MFCERNKEIALRKLSVLTTVQDGTTATDVMHDEQNTQAKKDEEKESEEKKKEIKMVKNEHIRNLEIAERNITRRSSWLLGRSASLTCTETIDDISVSASSSSRSFFLPSMKAIILSIFIQNLKIWYK